MRKEERLAFGERISLDNLQISSHALHRFHDRTRTSLIDSPGIIRRNLPNGELIEGSEITDFSRKKNKKKDIVKFHVRDPIIEDLVYVLVENKYGRLRVVTAMYE
jgi:hypothetical protein